MLSDVQEIVEEFLRWEEGRSGAYPALYGTVENEKGDDLLDLQLHLVPPCRFLVVEDVKMDNGLYGEIPLSGPSDLRRLGKELVRMADDWEQVEDALKGAR